MIRFQSSICVSAAGALEIEPALFTKTSTFRSDTFSKAVLMESGEETSHTIDSTFLPMFLIVKDVDSSDSWLRPTSTISAPACASACAIAAPIPLLEPVTIAFFPVKEN